MTTWLVDKSALVRVSASLDATLWAERAERGLIHITTPTLLEYGFSARSAGDWEAIVHGAPIAWLPVEYATPAAEKRAVEVQSLLARRGLHRAPSVPDLLIAAIAETARHTVLHLDKDYELIAGITGQPVERLRI